MDGHKHAPFCQDLTGRCVSLNTPLCHHRTLYSALPATFGNAVRVSKGRADGPPCPLFPGPSYDGTWVTKPLGHGARRQKTTEPSSQTNRFLFHLPLHCRFWLRCTGQTASMSPFYTRTVALAHKISTSRCLSTKASCALPLVARRMGSRES